MYIYIIKIKKYVMINNNDIINSLIAWKQYCVCIHYDMHYTVNIAHVSESASIKPMLKETLEHLLPPNNA